MATKTEIAKQNPFFEMERQEIEGLTNLTNMSKPSIPLKVTYDDVLVSTFYSDMKMDPREKFNKILAFAEARIDDTIADFVAKDSSKIVGLDSWQIKIGFINIDLCLHCFTKYDCSEEVFEDTANHNVVVTMVAYFDTKKVYRSPSHAKDIFEELNKFHCNIMSNFIK